LSATSATITNLTLTSLVISNLSIASANITTLTGSTQTLSGNLTLNGGTANGVLYLNGSKVATSGSALTFDGTNFTVGVSATTGDYKTFIQKAGGELLGLNASSGTLARIAFGNTTATFGSTQIIANAADFAFITNSAERMRLDSSGNLGIGTSSPGFRLDVAGNIRALNSGADSQVIVVAPSDSFSPFIRWGVSGIRDSGILGFPAGDDSLVYRSGANSFSTGTERFRITVAGNVGIGTSSPAYKLDVVGDARIAGATNSTFTIQSTYGAGASSLQFFASGNSAQNASITGGEGSVSNLRFYTGGASLTEKMRITSGGAIGVNRTDPQAYGQFAVRWDPTATSVNNAVGISVDVANNTTNAVFAQWVNENGNGIGSITRVAQTNAVVYNTTSDHRLKSNIEDAAPVLEKLMSVQVRQYDWTEGDLHQDYGFVAQELEPVLSGIVTKGKTEEDIWQLDYSRLTPHLLKAIQEQQAIITQLTARVAQLESK
jgi:hypothetical protein